MRREEDGGREHGTPEPLDMPLFDVARSRQSARPKARSVHLMYMHICIRTDTLSPLCCVSDTDNEGSLRAGDRLLI